jgi:hypothetical protein
MHSPKIIGYTLISTNPNIYIPTEAFERIITWKPKWS